MHDQLRYKLQMYYDDVLLSDVINYKCSLPLVITNQVGRFGHCVTELSGLYRYTRG